MHHSFEQIYQQQRHKIYRLCRIMIYDTSQVDDLFQEVLINIWKSLPQFKGNSKVETYIYRIIVNTSITFNNRQKRLVKQQQHLQKDYQQYKHADSTNQSTELDQLMQAIPKLEPNEKAIIGCYLEGFSYKEIGAILELTTNHVGVKISRIKTKLAKLIKKQRP